MDYPQRNMDSAEKGMDWKRENAASWHSGLLPLMECAGASVSAEEEIIDYLQQPANRRKHRLLQVFEG